MTRGRYQQKDEMPQLISGYVLMLCVGVKR